MPARPSPRCRVVAVRWASDVARARWSSRSRRVGSTRCEAVDLVERRFTAARVRRDGEQVAGASLAGPS